MKITVGLLYSIQRFLNLVQKYKVNSDNFIDNNTIYLVANPRNIVDLSYKCNWITFDDNNYMEVTALGKEIIHCSLSYKKLRIQLKHYILTAKPPWFLMMHYGRLEASNYFPSAIYQCFQEAHLIEPISQDVIEWWDLLASISRNEKNDNNLEIGRIGEKLSYFYEKRRVGTSPHWQSIDSNFSGYDILSKIDKNNEINLMIEVKSSISKHHFFLTKNEWDTAIESNRYIFHLWILEPLLKLYVFKSDFIKAYIPKDTLKGAWQNCQISLDSNDLLPFKVEHNMDFKKIKEQEI